MLTVREVPNETFGTDKSTVVPGVKLADIDFFSHCWWYSFTFFCAISRIVFNFGINLDVFSSASFTFPGVVGISSCSIDLRRIGLRNKNSYGENPDVNTDGVAR